MDEDLQGHGEAWGRVGGDVCVADAGQLLDGALAGQDDELAAEGPGELNSSEAGDGHLRGRVDREIRGKSADEAADADILDDRGVDAGVDDAAQDGFGGGELPGEDEGIESDVASDAAAMEEIHEGREVGEGEVAGADASVVLVEAEVDGVGAIFDGSASALPVAGWGQQFGAGTGWPMCRAADGRVHGSGLTRLGNLTGNVGGANDSRGAACFSGLDIGGFGDDAPAQPAPP